MQACNTAAATSRHPRTQAEQLLPVRGEGGGARGARHLQGPRQLPGSEGHQADAALVAQERHSARRLRGENDLLKYDSNTQPGRSGSTFSRLTNARPRNGCLHGR